jgi:hypothetical protein
MRLLKVIVQPVFVEEDGEYLRERVTEAQAIAASEWAQFVERFAETINKAQNGELPKAE